jgi:hypothetical protein
VVPNFNLKVLIGEFTQRGAAGEEEQATPIGDWLTAINPTLSQYTAAFAGYGFDDTSVLSAFEYAELEEAMQEMQVKKAHQKLIATATAKLHSTAQ